MKILLAHAESEIHLAEQIAAPLRAAGYDVAHRGTALVGESIVQEASKILLAGGPVVLCGTVQAVGTGWAHRLINAARLHPNTRIYAVQMEKSAFLDSLVLDGAIVSYWQNPEKAISELLEVLKVNHPLLGTPSTSTPRITLDSLKTATHEFTHARIRLVGRDRYFQDLYVERDVSDRISEFVCFETRVREQSSSLLDRLLRIAKIRPAYTRATESVAKARLAYHSLDSIACSTAIGDLKLTFYFSVVNRITSEIGLAIQARAQSEFELLLRSIVESVKLLPGERDECQLDVVRESIAEAARIHLSSAGLSDSSPRFAAVWHLLPAEPLSADDQCATANALIDELDQLRRLLDIRCTTVIGPAGCGKTSLLCATAQELLQSYPTILVAGKHVSSREKSLVENIVSAATRNSGMPDGQTIDDLSEIARDAGTWIYVLIDGINENSNPEGFSLALDRFLTSTIGSRLRLILSCRDVAWPIYSGSLAPHLSELGPVQQTAFSDKEWTKALTGYQDKYRTRLSLSSGAEATLRHPLLLRLFFESYGNDLLGYVGDLRRLGLFDTHLQAALARIASRRGLLRPETARKLLMDIAAQMLSDRRDSVRLIDIPLSAGELEDPESSYNSLRSEGLIEYVEDAEFGSSIRFTYSELAEYVIALIWHAQIKKSDSSRRSDSIDGIITSSVETLSEFELLSGALVFLDELADNSGRLLNTCICVAMSANKDVRPKTRLAIVQMFDHLRPEAATAETFKALERLEMEGGPQVKDALTSAALRLLDTHTSDAQARAVGARILGIDETVVPALENIEHIYRFHIDAYEDNERMINNEAFQRDYYLMPKVREQSHFAFRFRSEEFTYRLLHDATFAEQVFRGYEGLHPIGWQEILAVYRDNPEFADRFDSDRRFREACLQNPEFVYDVARGRHGRKRFREFAVPEMADRFESDRLHHPVFIQDYLRNFSTRESTGRLLEMQSLRLRGQLLTNVAFRRIYLHNAHYREMWFRNPDSAWENRSLAMRCEFPPAVSAYVRSAKHKYEDAAKLNALSILARNEEEDLIHLMVAGIRELRVKYAIAAFRGIDRSSDKVAVEIARRFIQLDSADYVIFSAWLLRNRFGRVPAELLAAMLCHPLTRVHRYTMGLFDSREVEEELFDEVTRRLEEVSLGASKTIQCWHVVNLCRVVTKALQRGRGSPEAREAATRALLRLVTHASTAVSEASNRALSMAIPQLDDEGEIAGGSQDGT